MSNRTRLLSRTRKKIIFPDPVSIKKSLIGFHNGFNNGMFKGNEEIWQKNNNGSIYSTGIPIFCHEVVGDMNVIYSHSILNCFATIIYHHDILDMFVVCRTPIKNIIKISISIAILQQDLFILVLTDDCVFKHFLFYNSQIKKVSSSTKETNISDTLANLYVIDKRFRNIKKK